MPANPALPTLSQLINWEVEHLNQSAAFWNDTADQWEDAFDRVSQEMSTPGGTQWEGASAQAAQSRAATDREKVTGASDALRVSSTLARNAAEDITLSKRRALIAVGEAHAQGFVVDEDLGVSDKYASSCPTERAVRLVQARAFATDIRTKAIALVAIDGQCASQIASVIACLEDIAFVDNSTQDERGSDVQAVDFRQSPAPAEPQEPQPPRGLPPEGVQPPIPGDLMPGPASRPSEAAKGGQSLWDEHGGEWRYFPGDRYHNPHWDFNPHDAPHSPWNNVPIGDLPPVRDDPIITGLSPWLDPTAGVTGPPQNPLIAAIPGADVAGSIPLEPPATSGPVDMFPHVVIPAPNPQDLENAGAAGTGVVAGGGLLALLYMMFVQN